mmetsp:Transcript_17082/g.25875  ORF Transcript_17082/g.25875 Transcript_17082/m.25875 type:complete len:93 (-) Transcript_17082:757-1035(-)
MLREIHLSKMPKEAIDLARLKTELKLQAQTSPKWRHTMEWTKAMFPKTRPLHFRQAKTEEIKMIHKSQEQWIEDRINENKFNLTGIQEPNVF